MSGPEVKSKVEIPNPFLKSMSDDFLYHLGYSSSNDLEQTFGDIKFVVVGGSTDRMKAFAHYLSSVTGDEAVDMTKTDRYVMLKIGRTLSLSHGIGIPSVSIVMHELIKLLFYANTTNVTFIRMGTSGGIDIAPGTIVITDKSFNGYLEEKQEMAILGERVVRPTKLDKEVAKQIQACHDIEDYGAILGGTMSTDDFYEGQARSDGVLCDYSEEEKQKFLKRALDLGIHNIEMECTFMCAITAMCNLKCACVCVTLLDRLKGDQVLLSPEEYKEFNMRPQRLIAKFIIKSLAMTGENEHAKAKRSSPPEKNSQENDGTVEIPAKRRKKGVNVRDKRQKTDTNN